MIHENIQGKDVPGTGNSKCKGSEVGGNLVSMVEQKRGQWIEWSEEGRQ